DLGKSGQLGDSPIEGVLHLSQEIDRRGIHTPRRGAVHTSLRAAMKCSAFSFENTSGGRILSIFAKRPHELMRIRRARSSLTTRVVSLVAGSRVVRSRTNSP